MLRVNTYGVCIGCSDLVQHWIRSSKALAFSKYFTVKVKILIENQAALLSSLGKVTKNFFGLVTHTCLKMKSKPLLSYSAALYVHWDACI